MAELGLGEQWEQNRFTDVTEEEGEEGLSLLWDWLLLLSSASSFSSSCMHGQGVL